MILKLRDLIASGDTQTEVNGHWVRAMSLPFYGGLLDRARDAWAVIRGKCFAIHWPQHGELEEALVRQGEVLMPVLKTEQHVHHAAHRLGMHKRSHYVCNECDDCYREMFDDYLRICTKIIVGSEYEGQLGAFARYVRERAYEPGKPRNWSMFHEHPAYMVSDFLAIPHEAKEFRMMIAKSQTERLNLNRIRD